MKKNLKIAFLALGIALYTVLSAFVIIPIINRIKLDLGYLVYGMYLNTFGMSASIVGVLGCIFGNLLKGGSLPFAWAIGQLFIGLSLGYLLPKTEKDLIKIAYCIIITFIGIAVIKTIIEVAVYQFPIWLKFTSNFVAFIADVIPLIIGVVLNRKIRIIKE